MPDVRELSEAQWEANRANALHSPGPTTPEGRQRSSLNAMKHGLAGRTVVLPKEDKGEYRAFCKRMIDSLHPATPVEEELAQSIADQYWRLRRVRAIEEGINERGETSIQEISTLGTYMQRIERLLRESERRLQEEQAERKKEEQEARKSAISLYKFRKMYGLPWDPREFGFVYAVEEVEKTIQLREMQRSAAVAGRFGWDRVKYEAWEAEKKRSGGSDPVSGGAES
jgi:hypothetical protein